MSPADTLVASFARLAAQAPERVAFVEGDTTLDYASAGRRVWAAAQRMRELGVAPGERVALLGPNSAAIALGYLATHAAGAVAVPIGPDMTVEGVREILDASEPALVLADMTTPEGVSARALREVVEPPEPGAAPPEPGSGPDPEAPADLLFTTGTTGRKKGVLLSHAAVASAADHINAFIGTRADDVEVVPIPLSHSFGLGRLRCLCRVGHTLVLEPGMKNPALLLKRLTAVRATGLALVPSGFALLRRLVGKRIADVADHLRYVEIGSAPLSPEDRAWLLEHLPGTRLCHHFGLTEASRAVFADLRADAHKPGSIGRPSPGVEVRVLDDAGAQVAEGEVGELWVRGGMVMGEYWRAPELTAQTLRDGWVRTGDAGHRDADGYLFLKGRKGDVINVGGLKVSPLDVEPHLRAFEGVRDAACVGVPDPRGITGQSVKACLVTDQPVDEASLLAFLRGRLAEHELPKHIERVPSIPRTPSGKIQRHLLR